MEDNKKPKIRINLEVDHEINPKLYAYLEKINKRKRASILRRLLEDHIKE